MKKSWKILQRLFWIFAVVAVVLTACKKDDDDDDDDPVLVEDGTYIMGDAFAFATLDPKGAMDKGINEVDQEERDGMYEVYVALSATGGFNIVVKEGATETTYGPDVVEDVDLTGVAEAPQVTIQRGTYKETTDQFTVPNDGMYQVVMDEEYGVVAIIPVNEWGIIGGATPGGWSGSEPMPVSGTFDKEAMSFEATDVTLLAGDFKFRHGDGWKVVLTDDDSVKVNTNFGGAVDALVPGGANITLPAEDRGIYTITMDWTLAGGYAATLTKTADVNAIDYTNTELGLVGDGLMVDGNQHNWDETIMLSLPVVDGGTNYTWTWDGVEITTAGSFKIREGQDWNGKIIGFNEVTMAGLSADDFETNNDGNFVPLVDGTFDFELFINAVTEEYTLTVNPAGGAPELYMLGDGTAAGWDNTAALPLTGTGGVYTITAELTAGGYVKFIEVLGQWAPQYGTDENGTSTGGNLVYRPTEDDPDPAAIPAPETTGTYTIDVNTNDLTYTITAVK